MRGQEQTIGSDNNSSSWFIKLIVAVVLLASGYFLIIENSTTVKNEEYCTHINTTIQRITPIFDHKTYWKKVEICDKCGAVLESKCTVGEAARYLAKIRKN